MTREELRHRGTRICERLSREVAEVTPHGIRRRERTWHIVDGPGASFMIALSAWESDPTDDTKAHVKAAYNAVLEAWRWAAAEFESQRRAV